MGQDTRLPKVTQFKDMANDFRIRVTASNGNILTSSPEGYVNKQDCIDSAVSASLAILFKYAPHLVNVDNI